MVINAGIAGPRVPSACQDVMHFDQVCYDFPELRIVMRHGAEPWQELAVKLMLKWPGLYAGYFPMGLSLRRIFAELPSVPFHDHVWPKFLRENALRAFNLPGS